MVDGSLTHRHCELLHFTEYRVGIIPVHDCTERPFEGLYASGDRLLDDGASQLLIQLRHIHPRQTDADLIIVEHLAHYAPLRVLAHCATDAINPYFIIKVRASTSKCCSIVQ